MVSGGGVVHVAARAAVQAAVAFARQIHIYGVEFLFGTHHVGPPDRGIRGKGSTQ
jgi:hypothetical protein